jgi:hypothetical protein
MDMAKQPLSQQDGGAMCKITVNILVSQKRQLEARYKELGIPEAVNIRKALELYFAKFPHKLPRGGTRR